MKEKLSTRKLTRLSLLIAISAVAAYIPLPSPIGTVALDSAPGYFAALIYGGVPGAVVLSLGHIFSALKMGFPLGSIHLLISVLMGGCGLVYYQVKIKFNLISASLIGILLNGISIAFLLIPLLGVGFFLSMTGSLLLGATANIILAGILYRVLKEKINL